jgi:hypothetical protein
MEVVHDDISESACPYVVPTPGEPLNRNLQLKLPIVPKEEDFQSSV